MEQNSEYDDSSAFITLPKIMKFHKSTTERNTSFVK